MESYKPIKRLQFLFVIRHNCLQPPDRKSAQSLALIRLSYLSLCLVQFIHCYSEHHLTPALQSFIAAVQSYIDHVSVHLNM